MPPCIRPFETSRRDSNSSAVRVTPRLLDRLITATRSVAYATNTGQHKRGTKGPLIGLIFKLPPRPQSDSFRQNFIHQLSGTLYTSPGEQRRDAPTCVDRSIRWRSQTGLHDTLK